MRRISGLDGIFPEETTSEQSVWLRERANKLREKWKDHKIVLSDASSAILREIEKLRQVDADAPFMVLTIFLEQELNYEHNKNTRRPTRQS